MPRILPFSLVARLLGVLLLVAAGLKVYGLGVEPVAGAGIFSAPEVQVAAVEFEIVLALWLCSGARPILSWLISCVTFTAFAAVSSYLAWIGQSSCGCFGRISVNPIYALALDGIVLTGLALGRPNLKPLWDSRGRIALQAVWASLGAFAGLALLFGLFLGLVYWNFTSLPEALAYVRGDRVAVQPRLINMGEGYSGEQREVAITVANWTAKPIRLVGGTRDCSCSVNNLPVSIEPGETRSVSVTFRLSGRPGIFTRKAAFLIEDEGLRPITFRLTGRILPKQEDGPPSAG